MDDPLVALTVVTAIGCGLNAGVFFGFSSFVMKALVLANACSSRGDRARGQAKWGPASMACRTVRRDSEGQKPLPDQPRTIEPEDQ